MIQIMPTMGEYMALKTRPPVYAPAVELAFSAAPEQVRQISADGKNWMEYVITESCQMSVINHYPIDSMVWMCGGGAAGGTGTAGSKLQGGGGGGGGYTAAYTGALHDGAITIGAGGEGLNAADKFGEAGGDTILAMTGISAIQANGGGRARDTVGGPGGSGGGMGGYSTTTNYAGTGSGKTTIPFDDGVNWQAMCAGGGGGGAWTTGNSVLHGGAGGGNGSSGSARTTGTGTIGLGGAGGANGGGRGANANNNSGSQPPGGAATYYGSGGGGGAANYTTSYAKYGIGGDGYQGIVIIRSPLVISA